MQEREQRPRLKILKVAEFDLEELRAAGTPYEIVPKFHESRGIPEFPDDYYPPSKYIRPVSWHGDRTHQLLNAQYRLLFLKKAIRECTCLFCGKLCGDKTVKSGLPFCRPSCDRKYNQKIKAHGLDAEGEYEEELITNKLRARKILQWYKDFNLGDIRKDSTGEQLLMLQDGREIAEEDFLREIMTEPIAANFDGLMTP